MSALQQALSSRRLNRWLPWLAGVVLASGVIAFLLVFFRNTAESLETPLSSRPAQGIHKQERLLTALPRGAREAIVEFIATAPARKNLAASWALTHPRLKQGLTRQDWLGGNIPVVPYPAVNIALSPVKIDYAYADRAMVQVALTPKKGQGYQPQIFYVGVRKVGTGANARWLVDTWVPRHQPPVPRPDN